MKIAIPVWGESQKVFENGGHAPYYGIYEVTGYGPQATIELLELRSNPKGDPEHHKKCHDNDEEEACGSDHDETSEHAAHGFQEHHDKHHAVHSHGHHHHHGKGHHGHHGNHGHHGHSEEVNQKVIETLKDCDHFLAEWACGRTQATIKKAGVSVKIIKEGHDTARTLIQSFLESEAAPAG